MRGQGRVYRPVVKGRQVETWWLDYSIRGVRHRESAHTKRRTEALERLRRNMEDRRQGRLTGHPDRVKLSDLRAGLERHYHREGNRSLRRALQAFAHLEAFFGPSVRALDMSPGHVSDYFEHRLGEGAARGTVCYEIRMLSAAFSVAVADNLLTVRPMFRLPTLQNARTGFFEDGDFAALLVELPPHVRFVVRFLRMTGWRKGEALGLTWDHVDWEAQVIRLYASQTKGGDTRVFPFGMAPELRHLLEDRWADHKCIFVFHHGGARVKSFRKVWTRACKKAGIEGRVVHDLRRTAARDFRRRGVSEGVIMKLLGWKSRAMFDRYNIIDEADLAEAVATRFQEPLRQTNEHFTANIATPTAAPAPLSSLPATISAR